MSRATDTKREPARRYKALVCVVYSAPDGSRVQAKPGEIVTLSTDDAKALASQRAVKAL